MSAETPTKPLHLKYRPKKFADVVGQDPVVKSLQALIKAGTQQAYLFAGPSGVGKTTLARIAAKALGCHPKDIRDFDAATHSGADDTRALTENLHYEAFGDTVGRASIIDECHSLSNKAWQTLLKIVEEPPAHAFWFFCTTEAGKVPATIKTRCAAYVLKPVAEDILGQLFDKVADAEGMDFGDDARTLIIKESGGSPRQLLVNMAMCKDAQTKKAVAEILRSALGSEGTIELCRFLLKGGSWARAMTILEKLTHESPESVRIVVSNYFAKVAIGAKSDKQASHAAHILDCFAEPYNQSDQQAPLVLSLARALLD